MPKQTWWNLPADKRARVIDEAMKEFGARGFSSGSLNVIADRANVAKGSLFQYFDDKLDLFVTVCEHVSQEIGRSVLVTMDEDAGLFENLRRLVRQWVTYFRAHPVERRLAYAAVHELELGVRVAVRAVPNAHYEAAIQPLISAAKASGELRPDVDERMVLSLTTVVLRHLNSAPFEPAGDVGIPFDTLSDAAADRWALAYVDVLETAFA